MPERVFESTIKKIFSGTVIVTIGLLFNSFFSYLLQFYLGRKLSVEEYGTFNALLSLFYIINVLGNVIGTSLIKTVSQLYSKDENRILTLLFFRLSLYLGSFGLFLTFISYIFRNYFSNYLNIPDTGLFVFLGIYTLVNLVIVVPQSYLQGLLKFNSIALYYFLAGFLRLFFTTLIVLAGYKVGGVYIGLSIGILTNYLISLVMLKSTFTQGSSVKLSPYYKQIISFSFPVLLMNLGMNALNNVDVLMVKKYFDASLSGFYAGTVTLGKIILFGAGAITTIMFPQISALHSSKRPYMDKFLFLLLLQIITIVPIVGVFMLFPKFITFSFFGDRFANSIIYLPRFAIFMGLYVLANFITMFFLAIDKPAASLFLIFVVLLQFILINSYHNSLFDIININISIILLLLASLFFYLLKVIKKENPAQK